MSDELDDAGKVLGVAGQIISLAKDSPELNEAGQSFANSARTVAKAVEHVLLPIAAVNFAVEKSKDYFQTRFASDIGDAMSNVPEEHVAEPKPSVVAPAIQGLAFSHEEPHLKSMYINLIATAMTGPRKDEAHPAFVEVIRQLTAEEADLLRKLLNHNAITVAQLKIRKVKGSGYVVGYEHLVDLTDEVTREAVINDRSPAMLENWRRLGLISIDYQKQLTVEKAYDWVEKRPEYLEVEAALDEGDVLDIGRGVISRTAFGNNFLKAIS